jgi:acyl-CoA synthetase (AMP-forming)/AMP-acid ligase II
MMTGLPETHSENSKSLSDMLQFRLKIRPFYTLPLIGKIAAQGIAADCPTCHDTNPATHQPEAQATASPRENHTFVAKTLFAMAQSLNVAAHLSKMAQLMPEAVAVAEPLGYDGQGRRKYRQFTFRQLDADSDCIAQRLREMGVAPGTRLALLVPSGIDFVSLVFALLKAAAVSILIDPGMGRRNLVQCLADAEPEGFVAIPLVQAMRVLLGRRFPKARFNVTVGRCWFWGGPTLEKLRAQKGTGPLTTGVLSPSPVSLPTTSDDPAAIIFTTGSTGPPKGVLFTHGNFQAQMEQIRDRFDIKPGEIDLPAFPLFGLFNCAMGVTAVIPHMDPSRPAAVDPAKIIEAASDWNATQTFGSPAIWDRVGRYCEERNIRLPSLRRVLSSGAPVSAEVLRRMKNCINAEGEMHTPYGATEALPVASIAAGDVLAETVEKTRQGAGVCVGRKFPGIDWKVIRIVDGPIASIADVQPLPPGEIGELIVRGPQVTRCYVTRTEANEMAKIADNPEGAARHRHTPSAGGRSSTDEVQAAADCSSASAHNVPSPWHRMGDCGYLDAEGRFWFCGRVAHRVLTAHGPLYPICCEAIFNQHPRISRSALVGVGSPGSQRPVIIIEPKKGSFPKTAAAKNVLLEEMRRLGKTSPLTTAISDFLFHKSFPVDIRHNAKIFREMLALWAAKELKQ